MIQTAGMVLRGGVKMLESVIEEGASRDARVLMAHVLGLEPGRLTTELSRTINPAQVSQFEHLVRRRMGREPVSHITGKRLFWGRDFRVNRDVLDPRPETETLIALALAGSTPNHILDLGTGSGCILITLLAEWSDALGVASDLSEAAMTVARCNAARLGVSERARFIASDWFAGIDGVFDLIVSNPPYVSSNEMPNLQPEVSRFEPHMALTPGGDGLGAYRKISTGLARHLAPGGKALFEIGASQGETVSEIMRSTGLGDVKLHTDLDGRDRVVEIRR